MLERPERRRQPGEADDGVEDDVRLGALEQRGQVAADLRGRTPCSAASPSIGVEPEASAHELELGMRVDDLERLAADRAVAPSRATRFTHRRSVPHYVAPKARRQ